MFRLQDNVPEIYVQESRDFQLFTRLYDSVFGGVKFSIDSLQYAANTKECDNSLLELLKTKLGLYTDLQISDTELRYVLEAFPLIMRYKGSYRAIKYVLNLFQRITKDSDTNYTCTIINKDTAVDKLTEEELLTYIPLDYTIQFRFSQSQKHDALLMELIKLVVPTGYDVSYIVSDFEDSRSIINIHSKVDIYPGKEQNVLDDYISENEFNISNEDADELTSNVGIAMVPEISEVTTSTEYSVSEEEN